MKNKILLLFCTVILILTSCQNNTNNIDNINNDNYSTNLNESEINIMNSENNNIDNIVNEVDSSTINGKVICGYQGWFGTPDDGYSERGWMHWNSTKPSNKNGKQSVTFELFPDLREYDPDKLSKIDFDPLPDGRLAALFSSYNEETIDLHFKWMNEYGIDGVALQRFLGEAMGSRSRHLNTVAENVKKACEKYGRIFYICYDFSGYNSNNYVEAVKNDFEKNVENNLDLVNSERYLHQYGKPVIQLWGIGVNGNYKRSPEESLAIIKYFKDKGYYVIGGIPTDWRSNSGDGIKGFKEVYKEFDMISPWTVGRFGTSAEAVNHYKAKISKDMNYVTDTVQDYMPVIFPGFAWSLWNGGKKNQIPRKAGEFMKTQMLLVKDLSPTAVYIAMFDEYDEGTAIMKSASDSSEIPENSYFLTMSADGVYVSSDYYLRLVGAFTESFGKGDELNLDIPLSAGPIWWKTGFEKDTDAQINLNNISNKSNISVIETNNAYKGKYALSVESGNDYGIIETDITAGKNTVLTYYIYTDSPLPVSQAIFLIDFNGTESEYIHIPSGEVETGKWNEITYNLSQFDGKKITALKIQSSDSSFLIDDICIKDK